MDNLFSKLKEIVETSKIVVDRPRGSVHPRYADFVYPLDYGYLEGTRSQDGSGIDVWLGSGTRTNITGILVVADTQKKDSEIKVLLGCDKDEMTQILDETNRGDMAAILIQSERADV